MRPESSDLVPKLLLGNAVLEAQLRRAAFAATQYSRLHRFNRGGTTAQGLGREAELPGCAFPSWSLGTRPNEAYEI